MGTSGHLTSEREEEHGNEFHGNFPRCAGEKLAPGCGDRFGTIFLHADFPDGWLQSLFRENHRLFGFSRRAFGFDRGSAFWCAGHRWRPEHFAGLSRKTGRVAHRALPGPGHLDDAQLLGGARSDDGADPYGYVYEKYVHARRSPADFSVRCRTVQSGCPALALNATKRREPKCSINLNHEVLLPLKPPSHRRPSISYFAKRGPTPRG